MDKKNRIPSGMKHTTKWDRYLLSLSEKYGKPTELVWISKKREKFILEFKEAKILVINHEIFNFSDLISCSMKKAMPIQYDITEISSEPYILQILTRKRTNMLVALTIWSEYYANSVYNIVQKITRLNNL